MPEQKKQAVLAEDEREFREPYRMYLEDIGFEVKAVIDKNSLFEFARAADVLVVDACLPSAEKMEGIECIAELLKAGHIRPQVPVIFISGYREDIPLVKKKLEAYSGLRGRYRWVWKDDEFEVLGDAIAEELKRLK